jgi:hypothetical protein
MVKTKTPKSPLKWWRGFLGALLTFLIVVPYMMGADVEKYLRGWMDAFNQRNGKLHLELLHYQRHWFTSEGELVLTQEPLHKKISIPFKAYHGPLFFNAGPGHHFGLSFLKGNLDSSSLLGSQTVLKLEGPIQLTAFVPYFSDRELHALLPPLTLVDKENKLLYRLKDAQGHFDGDGLLQMELPFLTVSRLEGGEVVTLNAGLLRIHPENRLASFSAKQINFVLKEAEEATIHNLILQANTHQDKMNKTTLDLHLHFDQFSPLNSLLQEVGPFELQLGLSGLRSEGYLALLTTLKAIGIETRDLTLEQGEALEKGLANLFAHDALFELKASLSTLQGKLRAEFQGGFKNKTTQALWQDAQEFVDAFYTKGKVQLSADLMQALRQYSASAGRQLDPENLSEADLAWPVLLGGLKKDGEEYVARIKVEEGKIILNGKDLRA